MHGIHGTIRSMWLPSKVYYNRYDHNIKSKQWNLESEVQQCHYTKMLSLIAKEMVKGKVTIAM